MFRRIYRILSFFKVYKKNVIKHESYLLQKYGLDINFWYELSTTIDLTEMPEEIRKLHGPLAAEFELKKYIKSFKGDLYKLELNELVNVYEVKKLTNDIYGIAFGYSLFNNKKLILIKLLTYVVTILTTLFFIF